MRMLVLFAALACAMLAFGCIGAGSGGGETGPQATPGRETPTPQAEIPEQAFTPEPTAAPTASPAGSVADGLVGDNEFNVPEYNESVLDELVTPWDDWEEKKDEE